MPLRCSKGKVRYRVRHTSKGKQRLAFCGSRVIETKDMERGTTHKVSR